MREISGLSLEEMAKCIGISVYSVKTIEQGRVARTVNIETLLAIFVSFGVTPSDMFIGDKEIILKKYSDVAVMQQNINNMSVKSVKHSTSEV